MPATRKQLSVNLDPDVRARLKTEAKSERRSMATVVNQILRSHWGLTAVPRRPVRGWTPRV
jgi:predicted HicB family RNase H-like nuclease